MLALDVHLWPMKQSLSLFYISPSLLFWVVFLFCQRMFFDSYPQLCFHLSFIIKSIQFSLSVLLPKFSNYFLVGWNLTPSRILKRVPEYNISWILGSLNLKSLAHTFFLLQFLHSCLSIILSSSLMPPNFLFLQGICFLFGSVFSL